MVKLCAKANHQIQLRLPKAKWREFNAETKSIKPVSDRWLTETLQLYVSHLRDLPATHSVATIAKEWGKPQQQSGNNNELLSVWTKGGDSWFRSQIGLLEQNGCLKLVIVFPGVSSFIATLIEKSNLQNKNLEALITTGILTAYFYRPESCSA
ncbi:MAG: hypothetical protein Q7T48_12945, partial [Cellvibrio sp.]|uniref:hypothetical protein n=1 Tax=Cellvibrio sp. TaxID=1965322 RepID=UPI0027235CB7|nr:hypothetical protein [Cellvibrio sp.]